MPKVYSFIEIIFSLLVIVFGILAFDAGYFGSPRNAIVLLPLGAMLLASGCMVLAVAIRSRI